MSIERHHHLIDRIAIVNAVISGVALYPQAYLLATARVSISGVSSLSFWLILSNSLVWVWYGFHRKTYALVISSMLNAFAAGVILVLI